MPALARRLGMGRRLRTLALTGLLVAARPAAVRGSDGVATATRGPKPRGEPSSRPPTRSRYGTGTRSSPGGCSRPSRGVPRTSRCRRRASRRRYRWRSPAPAARPPRRSPGRSISRCRRLAWAPPSPASTTRWPPSTARATSSMSPTRCTARPGCGSDGRSCALMARDYGGRAADRGLRARRRGGAGRDQRLGVGADEGQDPAVDGAGRRRSDDEAGAGQRRVPGRQVARAVRPRRHVRGAVPRTRRHRRRSRRCTRPGRSATSRVAGLSGARIAATRAGASRSTSCSRAPADTDRCSRASAARDRCALLAGLRRTQVAVALPKFRLTTHVELAGPLSALGMRLAFDPGRADLSGIAGMPGYLYIHAVVHEAYLSVDEAGTEAAAATGIGDQSAPRCPRRPGPVSSSTGRSCSCCATRGRARCCSRASVANPLTRVRGVTNAWPCTSTPSACTCGR